MKKIFNNSVFLPVLLIVIYFLGLLLGACAVSAYPIYFKQQEFFRNQARAIALEYPAGNHETIRSLTSPNTRILIYDSAGTCLLHVEPTNSIPGTEAGISAGHYLPAVLSGKEIYRPTLANETQREMKDIMVVTGAPITENGIIVGAVVLVKNLIDLPATIVGYFLYFTIFYWLAAAIIVIYLRKSKKLDELRQNYIANVTHALKTPVASIKALSETLCDGVEPDPDQQKVYYGMILREANRQDHMIRDILELSKLQSNGMDFSKTRIQAADIFGPILEKYRTLADCMDISLHTSDSVTQLSPLYTNAACIKQILEILLDNALKFVPEGGDIWVDATASGKTATICIRDNGIGIIKDALPHVFERFYKYSHDFNDGGSGLGLAIAKEIIAGLKEKIWVESNAGKGTAFYFTIRLK